MRKVLPYVEKADPQKIIYISSTGVYKDEPGFPEYDENASTNNSSDKAIQLRNAELLFLNHKNWNISVVRFGGLFGGDRHPVKYLAGKKELKNPDAPVNLVHREDCINALEKLIGLKKIIRFGMSSTPNILRAVIITKGRPGKKAWKYRNFLKTRNRKERSSAPGN